MISAEEANKRLKAYQEKELKSLLAIIEETILRHSDSGNKGVIMPIVITKREVTKMAIEKLDELGYCHEVKWGDDDAKNDLLTIRWD